jgi:mannose-6-phosphate isomerase
MKPLRFHPVFQHYLWGGYRLANELGKPVATDRICAESWEIVDHRDGQSVVAAGPWKGKTLHELVISHGPELLGRHDPLDQFPLLIKLLDAQEQLSVQVHPDDEAASRLHPPDRGKTEAWIVLSASPGGFIYAGLKQGFDRAAFAREVARGTCELCLHRLVPEPGDCIFLPAGLVHALGPGLMVAEVQQSSNATFRLYDWNRVGQDGKTRELHIEAALEAIDYELGPAGPQMPTKTDRQEIERLVSGDKFVIDRWTFASPMSLQTDDRFHIIVVIAGKISVEGDYLPTPLQRGETILIPASYPETRLAPEGDAVILDIYLP